MTEQRKLLSTKEAAEYCGFKLSYFRKLMMRRAIPMYKPTGKLCFFKKEDLDAFLTVSVSPHRKKSRRKPAAIWQDGSKQLFYSHQKTNRSMEQNRNMEQGGTAAAVPTEKKNENRKREVSGKDAQIIRAFLESVGIYEADALRVSIAIADGKVSADNISADDRLALNRYLNSSTDNDRLTADNAQGHRLNRAFGLLERVSDFCDKHQLVTVNKVLLSIAVNAEDINRAVSSLDKRPASVQPTQANTVNNGVGK